MDIVHVAAAMEVGADTFVSFDERQSKLAKLSGLVCLPHVPARNE
jgi:predicted nucleic acid-binding protein